MAKGKFRVFLIYEFCVGLVQGAEPRFSIADYLRCYLVIFVRVKLLTLNPLSYVVVHLTAKTRSTPSQPSQLQRTSENGSKGIKESAAYSSSEKLFSSYLFFLLACSKCCKYSLLLALFRVVPRNSS